MQPQATSQTLAQTPAQRPLPQPSAGANATILPFASQSADNQSPGSNRPFPTLAIQATVAPSPNPPSPKRGRPLPTPTGTTDKQATMDLGRLPHGFSSSFVKSAFSTQSSISSQPQPQPITAKRSPSPSKRPLPAPSSHSPVKKSESVGLSRTSSFAIQNSTSSASSTSAMPKRRITPPTFQSQPSSESNSPTKENAPASSSPWNKFSSLPAAVSTIPKSTSTTTSSSISTTSATTSNSTSDTSVPPTKKFTPIWKHTIPDYPAPAWGYAVGMVSEPHPKPKTQVSTQPAPAGAAPVKDTKGKLKKEQNETVALPPPPVPAVSSTKSTTQHQQYPPSQYRQLGQPGSTSFIQSGVQQRHTYQQQQAHYGHARSSAAYSETQDEDEEDDEEDSEEETDSDEEDEDEDEDDDEDEEQPDPRYNAQNKRQNYTRPMASIGIGANVPSQSLSRGYDQNFKEEMIYTPKRKLRLKPKVNKMDPYTAYIDVNTNGHKNRIVPRRGRDDPQSQVKDITPKANKNILKPKKRILSEKPFGFGVVNRHTVHIRDDSDDDGRGERKRFQAHERSRSAYEGREREVAVAKQRRQLERKAGSVDDVRIIRRQDEDDREVRLAYDDDEEEEGEEGEGDIRMGSRRQLRQVMKTGTPRGTPERRQGRGQVRGQGSSPQWDIRDIPANQRVGPARFGNNYEDEEEEDLQYRCVRDKEKEWHPSPILKPTNRRFQGSGSTAMVCEITGGAGVPEKSMKGGPRWKSTPLKYDDYDLGGGGGDVGGRRKLEMQYHQQEEMTRKFVALRMNDRTSLMHNQGSTGWPADLPRLPRTPGSSSGSVTNDGGDYFDMQPQPVSVVSPVSEFSGRQLRSAGISGKMNISLEDPRPRVTVLRSLSLSPPVLTSRRQPLPQPPRHPENQTYSTSGADDRIGERLQLRRSLYSNPETVQVHEEEGLKKRPQSQIYGSATTQMQAPIVSRNQQQQQQQQPHLPFSNQIMHNSTNYQPQTPAPLPIIGIESPHPVGGRDKLADIPMLEEGSNDESEGGHRQRPNHRRVQVPRINVASDPSSSPPPPPPRIQVDGSGPSIPSINLDSSPRMNSVIGPIVDVEPPRINVDGGDSPRGGGGPNISVFGSGARNLHSHHAQSVLQQPQFGGQQTHGRQTRPAGGLICGGCNGSIIGRIVSAMGSRWHPACFRCTVCNELLEHVSSYEHEGQPYCHLDYHEVRSVLR